MEFFVVIKAVLLLSLLLDTWGRDESCYFVSKNFSTLCNLVIQDLFRGSWRRCASPEGCSFFLSYKVVLKWHVLQMFHRRLRECLGKLGPNTVFFWKNEFRWDDSYILSNKLNLFYIPNKVFVKVFIQRF